MVIYIKPRNWRKHLQIVMPPAFWTLKAKFILTLWTDIVLNLFAEDQESRIDRSSLKKENFVLKHTFSI